MTLSRATTILFLILVWAWAVYWGLVENANFDYSWAW